MTTLRIEDAGKGDRQSLAPLVVSASSVGRVARGERRAVASGEIRNRIRFGASLWPHGHTGGILPRPDRMGRTAKVRPDFGEP